MCRSGGQQQRSPDGERDHLAVLAGEDAPRSHAHLAYVALELTKVVADFDDESCDLVVYGPTLVSARGRRP